MPTKNRHYWMRSGSYALMTNVQSLLFGFGSFYLLVRMLDKHSFGIWALFVATTTIFDMARSGLIQNALIKFLSHSSKEENSKIYSASIILSAVLMGVCIIINVSLAGYLARIWHYPALTSMFYTYNIVYLLQGVLSQFQWIEQANLGFKGIFITNTIKQGGLFIFIAICFFWKINISLIVLIYVQAIAAFLSAFVEYFFVKQYLSFSFTGSMEWIKTLFNYGKFVFGTAISAILANTINQMMIGAMLSADAAGTFNVVLRIVTLIDIPTIALSSIVFPQSARRFAAEGADAGKYLYEKSVGTLLAVIIPCLLFLFIFPGFTIRVIAGSTYADAIPILQITILTCLFNPFGLLFGTILDSIGKPKVNFLILVGFTALKLVLNYFLIGLYGIVGAVYATLITDVLIFTVQLIILRKELGVNALNTFIYAAKFYPEFIENNKHLLPWKAAK